MTRQLLETRDTKVVVWDINGRVWHISGANAGREGVRLAKQSGFMFAPVQLLVSEGARQDGATFHRSVRSKKEWDFVVVISGTAKAGVTDPVRDFYAVHDAWFRGWSTDIPVTVGTFTRHQGWRFQRAQLELAPEPIGDVDPARNALVMYKMSAVAMDPLEHHFEETSVWTNTVGRNEGIVRARNAADQPAWPRYTMNGPGRWSILDPTAGDLTRMVQTPMLKSHQTLRIDTDPRRRTARLSPAVEGENPWAQMAGRRWLAALPPWSSTDITVRVEGGTLQSSLIVSVTPRSSRPF
ncbi:phage tail protein [Nocardia sp. CDC159]|uniref:Phage tail protein n=1 Tax=Nocardia pulmonis TaxID=2951408 RepID=A0A9X2EBI2_9NOCA|nr:MULTISPECIES: phage tail protein [Nocardia]MCM6777276.1 phage tail protein [Nocardia pulmonis]MCM6790161.1 phage tail protein [Nocardia sp. CDC159]